MFIVRVLSEDCEPMFTSAPVGESRAWELFAHHEGLIRSGECVQMFHDSESGDGMVVAEVNA